MTNIFNLFEGAALWGSGLCIGMALALHIKPKYRALEIDSRSRQTIFDAIQVYEQRWGSRFPDGFFTDIRNALKVVFPHGKS